jgi:hypothetical protein
MKSSRKPSASSASASASGMLTSSSPESAAVCGGASGGRVGAAFFVLEGMTATLGVRIVFISSAVSYYFLGWSIGPVVAIFGGGKLVPLTFFFWLALFGGYDKVYLLY